MVKKGSNLCPKCNQMWPMGGEACGSDACPRVLRSTIQAAEIASMFRESPKKEMINHPDHYGGDTPYETIKVLKAWLTPEELRGFCKGNAIKYLSRRKDSAAIDAGKAAWYSEYLKTLEEEQ